MPVFDMVAASTTVPCTRAAIAIVGYRGSAPLTLLPAITPDEITNFRKGATCTCGGAELPIESGRPIQEPPSLASEASPESTGSGSRSVAMLLGMILGGVNGFAKAEARATLTT